MGFIKDNTNTFEVYLTDLGKEKFFNGGFKDSVVYFSVCDGDSNYDIFSPSSQQILTYSASTVYSYNDIVKYGDLFYKYKSATSASGILPTTSGTWDQIVLFNPTVITPQPIPTINHHGTRSTSLGNASVTVSDDYINDVFVQVPLRGKVSDNIEYGRALLGTRQTTQRDYIMQEPDIDTNETLNLITYINI
jgi:hypothetical protein